MTTGLILSGFYGLAGGPLLVSLQPSLSPGGMPAFVASNKSKHACWRRKRQITKRLFLKGYNKVLIYHQFASAAARAFKNVMSIPACKNGGQHGVIAEDRRLRRAKTQE